MAVPLFDTSTPLAADRREIRAKVNEIIDSKRFIFGPEVEAFEREFAAYIGTEHAVGVANGTDALLLALRALGVGPGDEVVVPSFTFFASAEPIVARRRHAGLVRHRPGDVRVDRRHGARGAHAAHQGRDRRPPVRQRRADRRDRGARRPVIEDAAQAAGTRARRRPPPRRAHLHARHVLVLPVQEPRRVRRRRRGDDERRRRSRRRSRCCASTARTTSARSSSSATTRGSTRSRPGILRVQLPHLDSWADGRRAAARAYAEAGLGELVTLPVATDGAEPAWHLYVAKSERADELIGGAQGRRHRHGRLLPRPGAPPARDARLPADRRASRAPKRRRATNLALPMSPVLTAREADEVVAAVGALSVA